MPRTKPIIAICYDFDGTLSPRNMQEYDYLPQLNIHPKKFWAEAKAKARSQGADDILAYMCLMLEKAHATSHVKISRSALQDCGRTVALFPGVEGWFDRISRFAAKSGASVEHYIISSGIREMIEGTPIAKKFKRIYASSFMYDQHDVAKWPGMAINYTTKTQFLFRINKGALDPSDNSRINTYIAKDDRPVPFERMIYIGDGTTDIPCMKLVRAQGGYSIAVFKAKSRKKSDARKLLEEERVNFVSSADYRNNSALDRQVKRVIARMLADAEIAKNE
jgi:2-hydroxy-3-keto-5-methylthiopentenyl-1-phosphate phosphatase